MLLRLAGRCAARTSARYLETSPVPAVNIKLKDADDSNELGFYVTSDLSAMSGTPNEHIKGRVVTIYPPAKNAMQSGKFQEDVWKISFDTRERFVNPNIGWASSSDPISNVATRFQSKEQAINYVESMGWKYVLYPEKKPKFVKKDYGAKFSFNKRTRVSCK